MVCITANNHKESSSINDSNNKTHLESLGIDDVTRLAMQEMTKKASVNETDGSAVNTTAHGLAPSKRKRASGAAAFVDGSFDFVHSSPRKSCRVWS